MDNNNNPMMQDGQGMPMNNQPMQPNMQPNMGQPMQQPNMGQPMMQPGMMQPNMGQPMQQPMMNQPKQPMDPAKKKRIIIIVSVISGLVVLGVVAAILLVILLRVDYGPAYKTAKELQPKIYSIYQSYDCEYVINYVDSSYTSTKTYNGYIEGCKSVYTSETTDLVNKLGDTDGVKRNNEIKLAFDKFKAEYAALSAGDSEELDAKLALWQAYHSYEYAVDDLSYNDSSDSEFTTAANYLINSGNDTLKTYGEGWLERSLEVAAAYRDWYNSIKIGSYNTYSNKRKELSDWVAANKPSISSIAPLNFDDTSKMYSEFNKLYDLIAATYSANYNSGSGDCTEFLGEVYCD